MTTMDNINKKYSKGTIKLASEGTIEKHRQNIEALRAKTIQVKRHTLTEQRWVTRSGYAVAHTLTARILSIFSITA